MVIAAGFGIIRTPFLLQISRNVIRFLSNCTKTSSKQFRRMYQVDRQLQQLCLENQWWIHNDIPYWLPISSEMIGTAQEKLTLPKKACSGKDETWKWSTFQELSTRHEMNKHDVFNGVEATFHPACFIGAHILRKYVMDNFACANISTRLQVWKSCLTLDRWLFHCEIWQSYGYPNDCDVTKYSPKEIFMTSQ